MKSGTAKAILRRGRDTAIARGHPWVFSGAISVLEGKPGLGAAVDVYSFDKTWLGRGLLHPDADLRIRIYSRDPARELTSDLFAERARQAVAQRKRFAATRGDSNAYRVIFSEADGLSGLVVDRYADVLSGKLSARVLIPHLPAITKELLAETGCSQLVMTADPVAMAREGITEADVVPYTPSVPMSVRIRQDQYQFDVDPLGGHKTGFYLDQRANRQRVACYAKGARVLSAYCYTGAFEVYAAGAGATDIVGLDESTDALKRAFEHHQLNELKVPTRYDAVSVPKALRQFRDRREQFDLIVLDPPRFVARRNDLDKGMRAYKDINLLAIKLLTRGGTLATFSCSGLVSRADFRRSLEWAAADAGRTVRILETLSQPPDHPVLLSFPESEYLKGYICSVV